MNFENNPSENAPIRNQTLTETNFKGVGLPEGGDTHFSYVNDVNHEGFHVTTQLPGGIRIHDNVNDYFEK